MKEKKEHAGIENVQRQVKAAGNGVMGSATAEEIRRKKVKVAESRQRSREIKIQQKAAEYQRRERQYSTMQLTVLLVSFLAFLGGAVGMVMSQSILKTTRTEINSLQSKYEKLAADNDALESSIRSELDIEAIFQIATEKMGMTYPKKSQVIVYQRAESEHVEQDEDIPKE